MSEIREKNGTIDANERMNAVLQASPLSACFLDKDLNFFDCNEATLKLYKLSNKQEFIERFSDLSPQYQPDGKLSKEKALEMVEIAFKEGYNRFEWLHLDGDGEEVPVEVTLSRLDYEESVVIGFMRDLREQKKMIEELSGTASRLKAVVSNYPGVICGVDKERKITLFDGLLRSALFEKDLSLEGQTLEAAMKEVKYKDIFEKLAQTFNKGAQSSYFDVNDKTIHITTAPIVDYMGNVSGVVGQLDDVTEMVKLQSDLSIALEQTQSAVDAMKTTQMAITRMFETNPHMTVLFDSNFQVVDCNFAAIRFMGFDTKEEMLDGFVKRFVSFIPKIQSNGKVSESMESRLMEAVKVGHIKFEREIRREDGALRVLDIELHRIPYENSFAIVAYVVDLTEIRENERQLTHVREVNELQLAILDLAVKATKIGLWQMEIFNGNPEDERSVVRFSPEFRTLLGFKNEDEFPDKYDTFFKRLHPDDRSIVRGAQAAHINDVTGKTPYNVEYRLMLKNGEYSYFRASGEVLRDEEGIPVRFAGTLININEEKNILFDIERQKIEAEAANRAKSAFLSTMSHEIRTPMNVIIGLADIELQDEFLPEKHREAFEKIYASGDMLLGIINQILDLSKIEAGKLDLTQANYETASLISDTSQLNMMLLGSKLLEFELDVDKNLPMVLYGDSLRIKQILNNLLSNAFKYTSFGKVKLTVTFEECDSADNIILVISVSDTGQGMTKEQVERLGSEYARFNLQANRATEGTGLGMNITKSLLNLMDGKIFVESEPGIGSTFTIHVPQGRRTGEVLGTELAENLNKFKASSRSHMKRTQINREHMPYGRVLVVDDVETNIFVAKGLLAPYGLTIESADSGFAAIEKIKNGKTYDIVFMDHMMPKMDGVEATRIMREMGYDRSIVALTANAVAGQSDIFLRNGFDDFISKPIDTRQLNNILNRLIRDMHPKEALEEARRKTKDKNFKAAKRVKNAPLDSKFVEIFTRDAKRSIAVLEKMFENGGPKSDDEMQSYIIHTHGMKGALANISKMDLSAIALKLEQAGRDNMLEIINTDTLPFLALLKGYVEGLSLIDETTIEADEDKPYLLEKLQIIRAACEKYDENAADVAFSELRNKAWTQDTKEMLSSIAELLLHSEFDEVAKIIKKFET